MTETPDPAQPADATAVTPPPEEPEPELAPIRTGLLCGLYGALGASAGWLLWIVVPQAVADPRGTLRSVVTGWLVGIAVELVRWYRRLSRDGGADAPRPLLSLVALPFVVLVVHTGAQDAVAELADAVVVPLVVSLSLFFLVGALLGFAVLSWLPSGRGAEALEPGMAVLAVLFWPVFVLFIVFAMALFVVFGVGYPIGRLAVALSPGAPVYAYLSWMLLVVVIAVSTVALSWRAWQVVPAWAVCCGLVLGAVATPFFVGVDGWETEGRGTMWSLIIPLSANALEAPDVPAATWLRADRELAAGDPTARSRAAATEDALNRSLRRRLGCGVPSSAEPPEGTVNATKWLESQKRLVARQQRMCETLSNPGGPGLTRSVYVASLFALGVAAGPWFEERTRPRDYRRHVLRPVDRGLLLGLAISAAVVLAVL